jgi:3-deoxy-D-manno-octulosonic-acid transferase
MIIHQLILTIYESLTFILAFILAPFFLLKQRGRRRIGERFGLWRMPVSEVIWIHAASLGEIAGIVTVIEQLKSKFPESKILVTSTSITGLEKIRDIVDFHKLLPFDSRFFLNVALRRVKITALIISETELWPALINNIYYRKAPIYLINARISDYTIKRYAFFRYLFKHVLSQFKLIMPATVEAKKRLLLLGAQEDKIVITGNSKYDFQPVVYNPEELRNLKLRLFSNNQPVLVLGSIRPEEEKVWFPAIRESLSSGALFNVVVAPRHKEKFTYFANVLKDYNFKFQYWSELKNNEKAINSTNVILLDTLGDLAGVYAIADLVFIGASLVDIGGHNPIEAAAYGIVICMGPSVRNVREIVSELKTNDAFIEVKTVEDAQNAIRRMLTNEASFSIMKQNAKKVWEYNFGASEKVVKNIVLANL